IDAALNITTSESTKSELRAYRAQIQAGTLQADDRSYVAALCKRLLDATEPSGGGSGGGLRGEPNTMTDGKREKVEARPVSGTKVGLLASVFALGALIYIPIAIGLVAMWFLFLYGIVVIVFRHAFGVHLPNPFD